MATKTIVVLANSVKRSGRCLAGKEVVRAGNLWQVGKWIRAVATDLGGEIAVLSMKQALGHDPELLEVVEIPFDKAAPLPDQPENWLIERPIKANSWKSVGRFEWKKASTLLDRPRQLWNDQTGRRRVKEGYPREMSDPASLYLVKPERIQSIQVWSQQNHPSASSHVKSRRVAQIVYAGVLHECDIDDPKFAKRYYPRFPSVNEPAIEITLTQPQATLLCVSITGAYFGHHYKIAAAFFEPPQQGAELLR